MTTDRRQFLRALGIAGIGALAGCNIDGSPTPTSTDESPTETATPTPGDQTPTATPTATLTEPDTPTPTPSPTATPTPTQIPPGESTVAASDGDPGDRFGVAVAVTPDGTVAVVGAVDDEDPNGADAGSAYVFERTDGTWRERVKLAPDDGNTGDGFGRSVSVSDDGSLVLAGAPTDEDPNGADAGSAYVFERDAGAWEQRTKLAPDDGDPGDRFGEALAVSGDGSTAVVGAPTDEDPSGSNAGSAYVFERGDGAWGQRAKLAADDGTPGDRFGHSVVASSDGTVVLAGAPRAEDPTDYEQSGSAYAFERSDGSWRQQAELLAEDRDSNDWFGRAVSLSGDGATAVVGANGDEDPNGRGAGSAYVFGRADGSWGQRAKLAADDGDADDDFGSAVAASSDGSTAVVGAPGDEDPNEREGGSAYVFRLSAGSWRQRTKLAAEDGNFEDRFGTAVAVSGDGSPVLVGAPGDERSAGPETGSVSVFDL